MFLLALVALSVMLLCRDYIQKLVIGDTYHVVTRTVILWCCNFVFCVYCDIVIYLSHFYTVCVVL